uniref:CS domain-containing protein n=1 Tax=Alexandrium monilatum TaxID=311494 RepID=A0A7S4QSG0_9DINO
MGVEMVEAEPEASKEPAGGPEEAAAKESADAKAKPAKKEASPGEAWEGVCAGKYAWGGGGEVARRSADAEIAGEAITQYGWADGKMTVSVYVELPGLDAVPDEQISCEGDGRRVSLTVSSIGTPPRRRRLALGGLAHEIAGVKLVRKPGKDTIVLRLQKKEAGTWFELLRRRRRSGAEDDDEDDGEEEEEEEEEGEPEGEEEVCGAVDEEVGEAGAAASSSGVPAGGEAAAADGGKRPAGDAGEGSAEAGGSEEPAAKRAKVE